MELAPFLITHMRELQPIRTPKAVKTISVETPNTETPEKIDLGFQVDPTKVYIFETIKKSDNPRSENLGALTKAYDNIEKRYRDLRYFPTAPSIFAEEQHESFDTIPLPPLVFWRNQIVANGQDIRLMEYLFCHPLYEFSPFRVQNKPALYTLADKEVQEEIKAKRHALEKKALDLIDKTEISDLKPIARTIFSITEDSDTAIINLLNEMVKKPKQAMEKQSYAEKLIDNVGNPALLRGYRVQLAIDKGIIIADLNQMRLSFVDGNVFITNLNTKDPVKEITDYTFTEPGGKFYASLCRKI